MKLDPKVIGVIVLVLIVGAYFVFSGKDKGSDLQTEVSEIEEVLPESDIPTEPNTNGLTLREVKDLGAPKYCTFKQEANDSALVGEIYFSGENLYMSSQLSLPGAQADFKNFLVSDGEFSYSWLTGQEMGVKFAVKTNDPAFANDGYYVDGEADFGLSSISDAICQDWEVDEMQFELPEDVEFEEVVLDTSEL